jgi:type II secretory pathway pseudopilin PulG
MSHFPCSSHDIKSQDGNVLIIILIAIALIAALTAAIQGSSSNNAQIDKETLILYASQVRQYANEMERGIYYIAQNGVSENDIRFSHPLAAEAYGDLAADTDKSDQVFAREGGGVQYKSPPEGVNNGDMWEFYGQTALPSVGSDEADLVAVLPNVTEEFCNVVNKSLGYEGQPEDTSTCIKDANSKRFGDGEQFTNSPNEVEESSFSILPVKQGCVQCTSDNSYHYFYTLISR